MWCISYSLRVKFGIALLVLVVLNSSVRESIATLHSSRDFGQTHFIPQYEARFEELHHSLSANQIVFYVDDFDESSDQCDAFYMAQYALAPTVLVAFDSNCGCAAKSSMGRPRLVVENLHDPRNDPYLLHLFPGKYFEPQPRNQRFRIASRQHTQVRDFGHGLRVYALSEK